MPKKRKKPGTRRAEKILYIFCEGAKDKSENAYFNAMIKSRRFPAGKIHIQVVDTKKTSAKELVAEAKKARKIPQDEAWAVFDKDGYTKHPDAFKLAQQSKVEIAFSSISFEYWILLHFKRTSHAFKNSKDIIKYMKNEERIDYSKGDTSIFAQTKDLLDTAIDNAKWIQDYQKKAAPIGSHKYDFNPYTDVNRLVTKILDMSEPI